MTRNVDASGAPAPATALWRLPADARVLVASDMHLGDHDPATAGFFLSALAVTLPGHTHLLLLGDVFEAWPGDDAGDDVARQAIAALARIAREHTLGVMRGNRDFLLDVPTSDGKVEPFSAQAGARMLDDPTVLEISGLRVLLAHGDAWCIDDREYMAFREMTRGEAWQRDFLARPLRERRLIARRMREQSRERQQAPDAAIGDVDPATVRAAMVENRVHWLVHGHTHRPGHHRCTTDGLTRHRLVLPDWDATAGRGGFVTIDRTGARTTVR